MKHCLCSLFFWNAFFGLTLFFVCRGLWFILYQLPWLVFDMIGDKAVMTDCTSARSQRCNLSATKVYTLV